MQILHETFKENISTHIRTYTMYMEYGAQGHARTPQSCTVFHHNVADTNTRTLCINAYMIIPSDMCVREYVRTVIWARIGCYVLPAYASFPVAKCLLTIYPLHYAWHVYVAYVWMCVRPVANLIEFIDPFARSHHQWLTHACCMWMCASVRCPLQP